MVYGPQSRVSIVTSKSSHKNPVEAVRLSSFPHRVLNEDGTAFVLSCGGGDVKVKVVLRGGQYPEVDDTELVVEGVEHQIEVAYELCAVLPRNPHRIVASRVDID